MRTLSDTGLMLFLALIARTSAVQTGSYDYAYMLHENLFKNYSTRLRPITNQSSAINVSIKFSTIAIVEINELQSKFVFNGFLSITWVDEILTWNPDNYGGIGILHPNPEDIWRPRLQVLNSHGDRDLFEDKHSFTTLDYTGRAVWMPGSLIAVSCHLDLRKFPFDKHECALIFPIIYHQVQELSLEVLEEPLVSMPVAENAGWELESEQHSIAFVLNDPVPVPAYTVIFRVKRRPAIFVLNIMTPVLALTVLTTLTFIIPVESGEKVGYSISVMLAYSVSITNLISYLPTASDNMPHINVSIFALFMLAGLVTMDGIFIVWLHNKEETDFKRQRRQCKLFTALSKIRLGQIFTFSTQKNKICADNDPAPLRPSDLTTGTTDASNLIKKRSLANSNHNIASFPSRSPLKENRRSGDIVNTLNQENLDDVEPSGVCFGDGEQVVSMSKMNDISSYSLSADKNIDGTKTCKVAKCEHKEHPLRDVDGNCPDLEPKVPYTNRYKSLSRTVNSYSMVVFIVIKAFVMLHAVYVITF